MESSATLATAPMSIVTIALTGYPDARIRLLKPNATLVISSPGITHSIYSRAYGSVAGPAPKALSMGSIHMTNTVMYAAALTSVSVRALPSMRAAPSESPRPRHIDTRADEPTPTSTPMAVVIFISGKVSASPAMASGPTTWPINMRSTTLYSATTSIPTTPGRLYSHSSRPTGADARRDMFDVG